MKMATRLEITALNKVAINKGYNRALAPQAITRLDPNGYSILEIALIHEHAGGVAVEPHFRCRVMLKERGTMTPFVGYIDIPMDLYNSLPDAVPRSAEVQAMQDR